MWLSPVFCSPQVDHGYDVSDYYAIDPIFGTMADFDELMRAAHDRGCGCCWTWSRTTPRTSMRGSPPRWRLGVGHVNATGTCSATAAAPMVQSLPPMCSDRSRRHRCGPGSRARRHAGAVVLPPVHRRATGSELAEPAVLAAFEQIWRFWLDKGVDGFRVDVADHLTKDVDRNDVRFGNDLLTHDADNRTHEVLRALRSTLRGYEHQPTAIGEIWSGGAAYSSDDEFPQTFGFPIPQGRLGRSGASGCDPGGAGGHRARVGHRQP